MDNKARVRRDQDLLLAIEDVLVQPAVVSFFKPMIEAAEAQLANGTLQMYTQEFSPKLGNICEIPGDWPTGVGTVRPFGLAPGAVMRIYERHPNSVQRIRVVSGTGTWHVKRPSGAWEKTTVQSAQIGGAPLTAGKLETCNHICDPTDVHFVENCSGGAQKPMVCLTWHEAPSVIDDHVPWTDAAACDLLSPYWRQFQDKDGCGGNDGNDNSLLLVSRL